MSFKNYTCWHVESVRNIIETEALQTDDHVFLATHHPVEIYRQDLGPIATRYNEKSLIQKAHWRKKGSIVATQMITSMVSQNHPTRAEVSDIATAIFDGADAVMMSEETATGQYPVEAIQTMVKVVKEVENYLFARKNFL